MGWLACCSLLYSSRDQQHSMPCGMNKSRLKYCMLNFTVFPCISICTQKRVCVLSAVSLFGQWRVILYTEGNHEYMCFIWINNTGHQGLMTASWFFKLYSNTDVQIQVAPTIGQHCIVVTLSDCVFKSLN